MIAFSNQSFAPYAFSAQAWAIEELVKQAQEPSNEVYLDLSDRPAKRFYVKRKKQILVFASAEEADAFLAAEQTERKPSRRARKRVMAKVTQPQQVVELPKVEQLAERFDLPGLPELLAQQDWARVLEIYAQAMQRLDDEEVELLLMAV